MGRKESVKRGRGKGEKKKAGRWRTMGGKRSVNEIGWEKKEKKRAGRWENCEREAECEK